ncbi:sialoadhesin-like isoform X2 [Paramormyrops kingsleyae]|uniref:sialoadhesin-like isoform X2 n=1 Tax=Paramormyrops kingsleyae TaxID=1676925 RepID=UPI003B975720
MGLKYALNFWIQAVVFLPGVLGSEWGVEYSINPLCAIRRSTVVIPCSYKYPASLRVETVLWCNDEYCTKSFVFHSSNTDVRTEYRDRAEYLGNKEKNCTLQIKNITDKDAGVYTFRFTTNEKTGKYTGKPGTTIRVDELKVVMTSQKEGKGVSEGDSVSLTCGTDSCSLSQSEFTWFKDNQQLPETQSTLHFRPACKYHSASYSCGLKGNRQTVSETVNLSVEDGTWTVRYTERNLCALRGSTVLIQCEYEYPEPHKVDSRMWSRNDVDCTGNPYVCHSNNANISAEYTGRAEFLGNNVRNCTLQIKNIRETDAGEYRFRFITNGCEKCGGPGVTLQVDELKVVMTSSRVNEAIREGDSVNLTCGTNNCSLSQSEFTWLKDNQQLPETQSTLHFSPACKYHSASYSCGLKGNRQTVSETVNLSVEDGTWTVRYTERNLCALRGSTVLIQCEYEYPEPHKVDSRMWSHNDVDCTGNPYVCHSNNTNISAEYTGRAEFLGNNTRNCALQIKNIRETDVGEYRFRFITNGCEKCGGPGVTLQVDELKVVMTSSRVNEAIREGDSVNLTCGTNNCSLSQSEFTWLKDNQQLPETQSTLHFSPACKYHSASYSCGLKGNRQTVSETVNLSVEDGTWTVRYTERNLCALRGSTVLIQCEYEYPEPHKVDSRMWSHNDVDCTGKSYVCHSNNTNISAEYAGRAEFLGNNTRNCALQIKNIRETDAGEYRFRFITNGCEKCGGPGVTLQVDELKVVMTSSRVNEAIREGDSVNLTCGTNNCSLSQSEFTWLKDNQQLPETQSTLHFSPACKYHSASYSCGLKGNRQTVSETVNLSVEDGTWTVRYTERNLCALRGSTVLIQCEYEYPEPHKVDSRMWSHNDVDCTGNPYVCHSNNTNISAEYTGRAEFLGNNTRNCALQIKNIRETDVGEYRFRFITNGCEKCGGPGVTLQVDELKVVMTSSRVNEAIREGDSVNLTCGTNNCSLSQSEFTWLKDNQQLPETQSTLHFSPACKYHSASYSCGLKGNRQTVSETVNLSVEDGTWTVRYTERNLCAVRGSTVLIQCEYEYPEPHKVDSRMWSHNDVDCTGKSYVCHSNNTNISAEYTGRAEFLGNNTRNCALQIKNIRETDAGEYRFRFITNGCEKCGGPGVTLQVDELKVVMTSSRVNGTLREGDTVNLICDTDSCSLSQSEFTWFKDNQQLPETQSTLHFSPISYHHTGKYSCATNGRKVAASNEVNIIVESHFNTIIIITVVGVLLIVLIGAVVIIIFMKRINSLNVDKTKEGTKKREDKDLCSDSETQAESAIYANFMDSSREKSGTSSRYSEESCELPDYGNVNIQERVYGNVNFELTEYDNVNIKEMAE